MCLKYFAALLGVVILPAAGTATPLTTTNQVKRLSMEEARQAPSVVLKGSVTAFVPEWSSFSLQDRTGAIWVAGGAALREKLKPGQVVEVQGHAGTGNFAPIVEAGSVRVLGEGELPQARPAGWETLSSGMCDNDYVEVTGVVRSVGIVEPPAWSWRAGALRLDLGGNLLWAYLRDTVALQTQDLVDASVRVRGVCLVHSNYRRQFQGNSLLIPNAAALEVLEPGPSNPFEAPVGSIRSLFVFRLGPRSFHRMKVAGVVTLHTARRLYIQQDNDAMLVRTSLEPAVLPGDRVEAVGFPVVGSLAPVMEDALVRVTGHRPEPVARVMSAGAVLGLTRDSVPASADALLVRMEGRLLDSAKSGGDETLVMQDGSIIFTARLDSPGISRRLASLAPGSRLAVTGVCAIQVDERGQPRSFEMLMRSPADVRVLKRAPLITRDVAMRATTVLITLVGVAGVWVIALRRRVRKQTETIRRANDELELRVRARTAELSKTSESLLASERRFRLAVENFPYVFVIYDGERRIQFINERGARLAGVSVESALGRRDEELFPEAITSCYLPALRRCAEERTPQTTECDIRFPAGGYRIVFTYVPVLNENGELAQILGITHDITELKLLQERLHQAQKLEALGLLAGGVAHDFNNMLSVIIGHAQLLADELPPGPRRDRVNEMLRAAERNAGLTRQLLAFGRRQILEPRVLDLNAAILAIEPILSRLIREDIALETDLGRDLCSVRVDPNKIEQILINLVINARDAMSQGGRIRIATRNVSLDMPAVARHPGAEAGEYILLEVEDTGHGMDSETLNRIFEPFFTTKSFGQGSGMGLSTVYGIVNQSGGFLDVDSEPGRGARFRVYLRKADAAPELEAVPATRAPARGKETVLLVEDEPAVRGLIRDVLRTHGYSVLEAADGRQAMEICEREACHFQLLITDVVMPNLGGPELAKLVLERYGAVKVLFITGYASQTPGPNYLQKPFTIDVLTNKVREVLDNTGR